METSGPNDILNALVEFIVEMRTQFLDNPWHSPSREKGRLLVVSHDWGGVCAFRLAAQTPHLADHFIVANAPLVSRLSLF